MSELKFFEQLDLIDRIIESVDDSGYVVAFANVTAYLDNLPVCRHFFEKIEDDSWLEVILDSGFIEECGAGRYPALADNQSDWYFLGYVLKVAATKPDQAYGYLKSIVTLDDERLRHRMIEVAERLPCEYAADYIKEELKWCEARERLDGLYPDLSGKLALHVQSCNEDAAFRLIKEILKVNAHTREVGEPGTDSYSRSVDVEARFSDWGYESFLENYVETFVLSSSDSVHYLFYFFDYMVNVLRLENRSPESDYSWIWRNTLEDNEQTRHVSGIKEYLLVLIRDVSITLIKEDNERFRSIVERLNEYDWSILRRLSIYLSAKFPDIDPSRTKQLVESTYLYEDSSTRNEYSLLLASAFNLVDQAAQETVYDWIDSGADIDNYAQRYRDHYGREPDADDLLDYRSYWKKTRLHLIRKFLDEDRLAEYHDLIEEKGAPEHPEYSSYTTTWVGPTSPLSVDQINELEICDLVAMLREWSAPRDPMGPSQEGLSRELSEAVKSDIERYKYSAELFKDLVPTYVRGVLQGFRDSISALDGPSWPHIFELSEWAMLQRDEVEAQNTLDDYEDRDVGWSWCRKTIASLIGSGLKKGNGEIPTEYRERVWRLILSLTQDPDPTPSYEAEYGGSSMDPATMAINSVRGEAMHALIEYGLWVSRNLEDEEVSFENIPEMRDVLDQHLDPDFDPSPAIRSVYGQYYPWLNLLDTDWARDSMPRIFSEDDQGLGDAAWKAYITFCQPYNDVFDIMKDIYNRYGSRLSEERDSDDRDRSLENFVAHLITFYWRSKLSIGDEILQTFYSNAPLRLREYVIEFIGRSLRNTPDGLENSVEQRLKDLYDWRQAEVGGSGEYKELEGICWWIDADVIERQWALDKFHELLRELDEIEDLNFAARKLVDYLDTDPLKVLVCLSMMLDKLQMTGMYFTWDDAAQDILKAALLRQDVKEQAAELVHKFGSAGFLKYRELLTEN